MRAVLLLGFVMSGLMAGAGLTGCGSAKPAPGAGALASAGAPAAVPAHAAAHAAAGAASQKPAQASPSGAAAAAASAASAASSAAAGLRVRLMAFNDFHGNLEAGRLSLSLPDPADPQRSLSVAAGGAANLAGLVAALREQAPHSLLISSGDLVGAAPMISTLFRHESTVDVMNRLGLELATVGNHEFDAGLPELQRLLGGGCASAHPALSSCALGRHGGARFATTAANVKRGNGASVFAPSVVRSFAGVKIGFIGAVTRETPNIVNPASVAGLRFEDEANAINQAAQALEAQGVRAIVAVVHEGGEIGQAGKPADWNDASCPGARGDIFAIERRLSPLVDVVFSAHTHQGYRCVLGGRVVMQAVSYGRGLSVVDLVLNPASGEVDRQASSSRNLPVFNERSPAAQRDALIATTPEPWQQALRKASPDAAIAQRVAAYAEAAAPRVNVVVGHITQNFSRTGKADSPAGRLVADAQLAATRARAQGSAQLALMNPGGIRTDLPCAASPSPCAINFGQVFAMQPFGNSLVVMTLTGRELKALLESQRRGAGGQALLLAPSSGMTYRWLSRARAGQQVADLMLEGRPVTDEQRIRVVVNSFLAEGGDGFALFKQGRERLGGPQDLDALVSYLARSPRVGEVARIQVED